MSTSLTSNPFPSVIVPDLILGPESRGQVLGSEERRGFEGETTSYTSDPSLVPQLRLGPTLPLGPEPFVDRDWRPISTLTLGGTGDYNCPLGVKIKW